MSKPLTMTVEREREYRACCTSGGTEVDPVFAELDATRAALAAAEAKAATLREFRGCGPFRSSPQSATRLSLHWPTSAGTLMRSLP